MTCVTISRLKYHEGIFVSCEQQAGLALEVDRTLSGRPTITDGGFTVYLS
jgi:hypothetical protein